MILVHLPTSASREQMNEFRQKARYLGYATFRDYPRSSGRPGYLKVKWSGAITPDSPIYRFASQLLPPGSWETYHCGMDDRGHHEDPTYEGPHNGLRVRFE